MTLTPPATARAHSPPSSACGGVRLVGFPPVQPLGGMNGVVQTRWRRIRGRGKIARVEGAGKGQQRHVRKEQTENHKVMYEESAEEGAGHHQREKTEKK